MSASDWIQGYNAALDDFERLGQYRMQQLISNLLFDLRSDAANLKGIEQRKQLREKIRNNNKRHKKRVLIVAVDSES